MVFSRGRERWTAMPEHLIDCIFCQLLVLQEPLEDNASEANASEAHPPLYVEGYEFRFPRIGFWGCLVTSELHFRLDYLKMKQNLDIFFLV